MRLVVLLALFLAVLMVAYADKEKKSETNDDMDLQDLIDKVNSLKADDDSKSENIQTK